MGFFTSRKYNKRNRRNTYRTIPKLDVAGSIPVSRSNRFNKLPTSPPNDLLQLQSHGLVAGVDSVLPAFERGSGILILIYVDAVAHLVGSHLRIDPLAHPEGRNASWLVASVGILIALSAARGCCQVPPSGRDGWPSEIVVSVYAAMRPNGLQNRHFLERGLGNNCGGIVRWRKLPRTGFLDSEGRSFQLCRNFSGYAFQIHLSGLAVIRPEQTWKEQLIVCLH